MASKLQAVRDRRNKIVSYYLVNCFDVVSNATVSEPTWDPKKLNIQHHNQEISWTNPDDLTPMVLLSANAVDNCSVLGVNYYNFPVTVPETSITQ